MTLFGPLLYLLLLFGLVWLCWPVKESGRVQALFIFVLLLKLAAGLLAAWLLFYRASDGDVLNYHWKAAQLNGIAAQDPERYLRIVFLNQIESQGLRRQLENWYNPSYFLMVKVVSLQSLLTYGSAWLNTLLFTIFSFLGLWQLWRTVAGRWHRLQGPAFLAFFLVPSVVFWGSGISKEALLLGGAGFVLSWLIKFSERQRPSIASSLVFVLSLFVLWQIRYFYLLLLLACFGAWWLHRWLVAKFSIVSATGRLLLFVLLLVVSSAVVSQLHPNFTVGRVVFLISKSQRYIAAHSSPEALIHYNLEPTVSSIMANTPKAIVTTLYRPFVWESPNFLYMAAALEGAALLLLTLMALFHLRGWHSLGVASGLVWAVLAFVLIMAAMLALNTPNFGTLVRYRTGVLPFFILVLLSGDWWLRYWQRAGNALSRFL